MDEEIDKTLMLFMSHKWQKTALVIYGVCECLKKEDDAFIELVTSRIIDLVRQGRIASVGDLAQPRRSEICLIGSVSTP